MYLHKGTEDENIIMARNENANYGFTLYNLWMARWLLGQLHCCFCHDRLTDQIFYSASKCPHSNQLSAHLYFDTWLANLNGWIEITILWTVTLLIEACNWDFLTYSQVALDLKSFCLFILLLFSWVVDSGWPLWRCYFKNLLSMQSWNLV